MPASPSVAKKVPPSEREKRYAMVLAAGKSTRFKSAEPKILHPLCGKPLICHVLDKIQGLGVEKIFVVVDARADHLKSVLKDYRVDFVVQAEQLGTAHAVMAATTKLRRLNGSLLVTYADHPLVRRRTLSSLFQKREKQKADQVLLTARLENPHGFGRIIRDEEGRAIDIVEEKDATSEQKALREVSLGFTCFRISSLLKVFPKLTRANAAREYYLSDVVRILTAEGRKVVTISTNFPEDVRGINNRQELAEAEDLLRDQIVRKWMLAGVTILNPDSVYIDETVRISPDTRIYPGVFLEGTTRVGSGCTIYGFCHLKNVTLEREVIVDHCSVIRDSRIGSKSRVGPFVHIRNNAVIGSRARIGNFVEIKQSRVGRNTAAAHLSYLGDAEIGNDVNVGAGTITCNYDGIRKQKTTVEDGVFIGSDSQLIAPVTLRRGSHVAAGSTVTDDVPPDSLAIARVRQVNKEGWAKRRKKKKKKKKKTTDS